MLCHFGITVILKNDFFIHMENEWNEQDINDQAPNEISEQAQRIIRIMEEENMNATQFAEAIGIRRAAMSHLVKGRNNPSADIITKVIKRFNTVNPGWLLTGDGNMRIVSNSGNSFGVNSSNVDNANKEIYEKTSKATNFNYGKEPDLFDRHNISTKITTSPKNNSSEENIRTEILFTDEINDRGAVKSPENVDKIVEKEVIIYKERPLKTIDKLLIFYSDNTFESFIPEKHL